MDPWIRDCRITVKVLNTNKSTKLVTQAKIILFQDTSPVIKGIKQVAMAIKILKKLHCVHNAQHKWLAMHLRLGLIGKQSASQIRENYGINIKNCASEYSLTSVFYETRLNGFSLQRTTMFFVSKFTKSEVSLEIEGEVNAFLAKLYFLFASCKSQGSIVLLLLGIPSIALFLLELDALLMFISKNIPCVSFKGGRETVLWYVKVKQQCQTWLSGLRFTVVCFGETAFPNLKVMQQCRLGFTFVCCGDTVSRLALKTQG
ncbi:hypothetical protein C0J52_00779 [Blattella germanica]|nr:hypothetical protein C0J52_00779 [Blattella germanica]